MFTMNSTSLLKYIEQSIKTIQERTQSPVRVAINGIEGAGKTTLSKKLVEFLKAANHEAHHVGIDGFHNPKTIRYQQGRDSADGYYEDAYNEAAFVEQVLKASRKEKPYILPFIHDLETDEATEPDPIFLGPRSIIITDGAYLFKPIYRPHWDLKIYLKVDFETAMERGIQRDAKNLGGVKMAKQKFLDRYHAASRRYQKEVNPESLADLVIDMSSFGALKILKNRNES